MANLGQMLTDLNLMAMGSLTPDDLKRLLNKCQRDEVESWEWSFSLTNVILNAIIPYQVGTVTLTQGSPIAQGQATNWNPSMNYWWMWVGPTLTTPIIINQINSATQATLSAPWVGPTQTVVPYIIQPLYYSVDPLIQVYNVKQIDYLVATSREALNRIDPSRIATGGSPSERWATAPFDFCGRYQIELWPRPYSLLPYIVEGKRGAVDMINDTDQPMIPSAVLESKALMQICRSNFASNGNARWFQLAQDYEKDFLRELDIARRADSKREITPGIKAEGTGWWGRPFDAALDVSHDFGGPPDIGT